MKEILEKIKKYLEEMNNKKLINNLFIILLISIMVLIASNVFLDSNKEKEEYVIDEQPKEYNYNTENDYSEYLEKKLVNILSKLNGVGKVNVMITLEDSVEKITAANSTTTTEKSIENDSEGGTREVVREDLIVQVVTKGNDGSLMVVKEVQPTVQGVIVVADGANDPEVRETLYDAVKTVLGVKANKVQVYPSK
jgi:stage III sporulation protein AG